MPGHVSRVAIGVCVLMSVVATSWASSRHLTADDPDVVVSTHHVVEELFPATSTGNANPVLADWVTIQLCECENALMQSNGGLNCEKEGWFISSFEMHGRWVCDLTLELVIF